MEGIFIIISAVCSDMYPGQKQLPAMWKFLFIMPTTAGDLREARVVLSMKTEPCPEQSLESGWWVALLNPAARQIQAPILPPLPLIQTVPLM